VGHPVVNFSTEDKDLREIAYPPLEHESNEKKVNAFETEKHNLHNEVREALLAASEYRSQLQRTEEGVAEECRQACRAGEDHEIVTLQSREIQLEAEVQKLTANRVLGQAQKMLSSLQGRLSQRKVEIFQAKKDTEVLRTALRHAVRLGIREMSTTDLEQNARSGAATARALMAAAEREKQYLDESRAEVANVDFSDYGQTLQAAAGFSPGVLTCSPSRREAALASAQQKTPPWAQNVLRQHEDVLVQEQMAINDLEVQARAENALASTFFEFVEERERSETLPTLDQRTPSHGRGAIEVTPARISEESPVIMDLGSSSIPATVYRRFINSERSAEKHAARASEIAQLKLELIEKEKLLAKFYTQLPCSEEAEQESFEHNER
jgi:hypothetical protein